MKYGESGAKQTRVSYLWRMIDLLTLYTFYQQHPQVATDTRKISAGCIFFALKGANFNGNAFAAEALQKGAAYCVVDEAQYVTDERILLTEDVLTTLQALARHHRQQFNIPFIAITGSNGKTTTKELVHAVLSTTFKTYTTQGNLNNHIGIPLTLLSVQPDAEIAVIEMGANHQKEIEGYCKYTLPTHGIITNCGKAHLEGFGGVAGVRKGKGELYDYLRASGGTAFVMWDYDYLRTMSEGIPTIIKYGTAAADINGRAVQSEPFLEVSISTGAALPSLPTQLVGSYNLPNVLVAVAVGKYFGVSDAAIRNAIAAYAPSNSRSQLTRWRSNQVVLDAYNANPSSMKLAVENMAALSAGKKILMLGAMAELGDESLAEHEALVALIAQYQWEAVVLVGGDFLRIKHTYISMPDAHAAGQWLKACNPQDAYILVKGSRSMRMEKVLEENEK
jgi:UDP-N-acetylmuramoyl-tripeptide--D-alanyl-D-alanine ligase